MKRLFCISVLFVAFFSAFGQEAKTISLKQEHLSYIPKGFYINEVVDDRTDKTSIGLMKEAGSSQNIAMQNGTSSAIKNYIDHNISQDKAAQPVALHVVKFEMDVRKSGGTYTIDAATDFEFYVAGKKVAGFSGSGRAQTQNDPGEYIEGFIRKAIENDLKRFESWWAQNKGQIAVASAVKVNVTIGRTTDKPNCIVYSLQRPVSIADFEGPVEGTIPELAATFSGIGMGYSVQTQNSQLVLNATVTPYFDKSGSWFKEEGKNPRVLAHEQAHFDITAIKACELAEAIRNTSFTQDNYEQLMQQLQKQNAKDANEEEATYDNETNHGIIQDKQIEWQNKLKQKVKEIGCY